MKVILVKEVQGLGAAGAVKEVKDGYARNYLLPRGLAVEATARSLRAMQQQQEAVEQRTRRRQEDTRTLAAALEQAVIELRAKSGEGGRLFGSVTAADVAQALAARGFAIDKKQVELVEPIRAAGFYKVPVRIGGGVVAHVDLNVVAAS